MKKLIIKLRKAIHKEYSERAKRVDEHWTDDRLAIIRLSELERQQLQEEKTISDFESLLTKYNIV